MRSQVVSYANQLILVKIIEHFFNLSDINFKFNIGVNNNKSMQIWKYLVIKWGDIKDVIVVLFSKSDNQDCLIAVATDQRVLPSMIIKKFLHGN